jgi:hypothetical protein
MQLGRNGVASIQTWLAAGIRAAGLVMAGFVVAGLVAATAAATEADPKLPPRERRPESGSAGSGGSVERWFRRFLPAEYERNHASVRNAFREIVAPASRSIVRVISDDLQVALGIVVDEDGYVLTKASEPVGSWLVSPNMYGDPAAIGVVSTPLHAIPAPIPALGVKDLVQHGRGVRVGQVVNGSGADRAGIRAGDVILSVNGTAATSAHGLTEQILRYLPGDKVELSMLRDGEPLNRTATLGERSRVGQQEQTELMDSLGGPLSRRRANFPAVLQHDSVLWPRDCGGPLLDLDGYVVGLNIARASRVATYALPVEVVRPAVEGLLQQARATSPAAPGGEQAVSLSP